MYVHNYRSPHHTINPRVQNAAVDMAPPLVFVTTRRDDGDDMKPPLVFPVENADDDGTPTALGYPAPLVFSTVNPKG